MGEAAVLRGAAVLVMAVLAFLSVTGGWSDRPPPTIATPATRPAHSPANDGTLSGDNLTPRYAPAPSQPAAALPSRKKAGNRPRTSVVGDVLVRPRLAPPRLKNRDGGRAFATAASANHLCSLLQLLRTLEKTAPGIPIVVYDLNVNVSEQFKLATLQQAHSTCSLRLFPYADHPSHFNVEKKGGHWAWKPVIIQAVLRKHRTVMWLDAGSMMMAGRNPETMFDKIEADGFYSAPSRGSTWMFIHQGMYAHFGLAKCCNAVDNGGKTKRACCCCAAEAEGGTPNGCVTCSAAATPINATQWRSVKMCNGAIVGFDRLSPKFMPMLLAWIGCASDEACIAPQGSSRTNHRQDQAALTLLATQRSYNCEVGSIQMGVALHKDEIVNTSLCAEFLDAEAPAHAHIW